MARIPLDLKSVRAARKLCSGGRRDQVQSEFGLDDRGMRNVESAYATAPMPLLNVIERLLSDRDRLRKVIASLQSHHDTLNLQD
jgi:hypothetical protein